MKREFLAAALISAGLLAGTGPARGDDLTTLSGTTYRDVHLLRAEPDGVTWRYEGGLIKVDFEDSPENIRRAYHYEPARAVAFREARAKVRQRADEVTRRDAREHEDRQRARTRAAVAQMTAQDGALVFRRALSPAASQATRETAARMQAEAERRAAEAAANPDAAHLIPALPGVLGPRPINPFMDTPDSKEFAASLHHSPTGATGNFVPTTADPSRTTTLDTPIYLTRSYYEDVQRAEAFARGVPLESP